MLVRGRHRGSEGRKQAAVGFTLVELLVVISIVMVLVALLLPALSQAKLRAKYARWRVFSSQMMTEELLIAYYPMEQEKYQETLVNQALGFESPVPYQPRALDGTFSPAPPRWSNGRWPTTAKKGLLFDGANNYVHVGNTPVLDMGGEDFSFEAWLNTVDTRPFSGILGKVSCCGVGYAFEVHCGCVRLWINNQCVTSAEAVNDAQWHHLAGTIDRDGSSTIYIDGRAVLSTPTPVFTDQTAYPFQIGAWGTGAYTFLGSIDEVGLWKKVLTPKEVRDHWLMGRP